MWKKGLFTALLAIGLAPQARAQLLEDYRFKGKIIDLSGKPLDGVQITFKNPDTGTKISFSTKPDGTFDRRMIPHSVYEVTFEKTGYVTQKKTFDWSLSPEKPQEKTADVTMQSEADLAKKDLGKKAAKLYEQAYAGLTNGDCDSATKNAGELLEMGAGNYEYAVRFVLARCHAMKNEAEPAIVEYRKVIEAKPDLYEAHFDLAGVYQLKGDLDAALQEFAKAAELKPEDAESQYDMGAILFKQGKFDEAKPHLEKAIELNASNPQAHKALGFALLQSKERDMAGAAEHLRKYLELDPSASDATQVQEIVKGAEAAAAPKGAAPHKAEPKAGK